MSVKKKYAVFIFIYYIIVFVLLRLIRLVALSYDLDILPQIVTAVRCAAFIGFTMLLFKGFIESFQNSKRDEETTHTIKNVSTGLFYIYLIVAIICSVFLTLQSDETDIYEEKKPIIEEPSKPDTNVSHGSFENDKSKAFKAIYDKYFSGGNYTYIEDADAKGYIRIILFENASRIEYLAYYNGGPSDDIWVFKHCRAMKDSQGSWSPSYAEYMNSYTYNFETRVATIEE